jgi:FMN-dependent NADH-azoreductase
MSNFGVPATLKTWIDYLVRSRVTFQYGETGPVGLITGKKVYLVLASGGVYSTGPGASVNHLEPYLRAILGFMGLIDVETILIEGVAMGAEASEKALEGAQARIKELAHGE